MTKTASGLLGFNVEVGDIIMTLKGNRVLVHCTDTMLRLLTVDDVLKFGLDKQLLNTCVADLVQTFKDVGGQYSWRCAPISSCGTMIVAAVAGERKLSLCTARHMDRLSGRYRLEVNK